LKETITMAKQSDKTGAAAFPAAPRNATTAPSPVTIRPHMRYAIGGQGLPAALQEDHYG